MIAIEHISARGAVFNRPSSLYNRQLMDRTAMLRQLLEDNPNNAFARYGLAMEYAHGGQVDAAMQEFATLLKANPDYTPAYFQAAQALARAERVEEARQFLRDGIACAERMGDQHAKSEMEAMLEELEK